MFESRTNTIHERCVCAVCQFLWRHERGRYLWHRYYIIILRADPFCSSLVKSKLTWLRPEQVKMWSDGVAYLCCMHPTYVAFYEVTWYGAWSYGVHRTRRYGISFTWHHCLKSLICPNSLVPELPEEFGAWIAWRVWCPNYLKSLVPGLPEELVPELPEELGARIAWRVGPGAVLLHCMSWWH